VTSKAKPGWGTLFLAWLGLFAGIGFMLWVAVGFWGRNLKPGVSPEPVAARQAGGVRVIPPLNNAPVMRLEEVTESNARRSFVGRMVQFDDVRVTEAGRMTFRVGRGGEKTLLVASSEQERPGVRAGQRVNLHGLIFNVPDAATIERLWELDSAQAARAERDQVYLRASTIEKP
jgi:hypothetical protein